MIALVFRGGIDREKNVAEYPLDFLDISKKSGGDSLLVTKKDNPCFVKLNEDGRYMVICPRVSNE